MRVVTLVILLLLAGGVVFVFVHGPTRERFFGGAKEAKYQAQGYTLATSPLEAMELFLKAIKARNYGAAARYCQGDYARKLEEADTAGSSIGSMLDKIGNLLDEKGLKSDKTAFIMFKLDPFPTQFKLGPLDHKDGADKASGSLQPDGFPAEVPVDGTGVDPKMILNNLVPAEIFARPAFHRFEIKKDKENWKISFTPRVEAMDHFVKNYKSYATGLETYRDEIRQGRWLKDQTAPELIRVMSQSK